jgi:BirA family transcriptional regulator, biotin operon repressor / biotin---[acetyl-CoA-carboxylase] ligase
MNEFPHIHLKSVDSTNAYARTLLQGETLPEQWTLVESCFQTDGKGRSGVWEAAPGQNILASYIVYPVRPADDFGCLPILTGIALADTITAFLEHSVLLKWPNDVLYNGKKISGVLCESGSVGKTNWAIIGIGINVNQDEFPTGFRISPTSMFLAKGQKFDKKHVLDVLSGKLHYWFDVWSNEGNVPIVEAWKARTDLLDSAIQYSENGRQQKAVVREMNPDGSLRIEDPDGKIRSLYATEISSVTPEE